MLGLVLGPGLGLGLRHGPRPSMPKCRQGDISLEIAGATTATGVGTTIAMVLSYHYPWRWEGPSSRSRVLPPVSMARLLLLLCLPPISPYFPRAVVRLQPPEGTRSLALQKSYHGVLGVTTLVVAVATRT